MKLYGYYRSSAAYRVRIVLNLKGLEYQTMAVNLLEGQQQSEKYHQINPQGLVPTLDVENRKLTQSLAIIEYLEECYPSIPLLPEDPLQKARARSLACQLACDIHPLNNLRVLNYLKGQLQQDEEARLRWYHHWLECGFQALEGQLESAPFSLGETPSIVDACLIPQIYNALRFKLNMSPFPKIIAVNDHCNTLPAFIDAHPDNQPDNPANNAST